MAGIGVVRDRADVALVERTGFRLSWGAIAAGVVVATSLQVAFSVLGLAIGLGAWDQGDPVRPFGIGAAVWTLMTALVTLFVGGLTAGRLAGILTRGDGMLHGVVVWGLSVLLAVWLVAGGAGAIVGGAFSVLGRTAAATAGGLAGAVGQVAGTAVSGVGNADLAAVQREVEAALIQSGVPALYPDSLQAAARDARGTAVGGDATNRDVAREIAGDIQRRAGQVDRAAVVNVLAARTDLSRAEADRVAERVENAVATARTRLGEVAGTVSESAGEVVDTGTDRLSSAAWWTLLALGLSAGAAALGAAGTART